MSVSEPMSAAFPSRLPFVIGITGHMDIHPDRESEVKELLVSIFSWLRQGQLPATEHLTKPKEREGLGLDNTPIILLSSLAPGADQIAAQIAMSKGIEVRGPLPFPHPLYREASTFIRGDGQAQNDKRLQDYDDLVQRICENQLFHVLMAEDIGLTKDELKARLKADLSDRTRRNLRYRAAGEYISAHCDILIAICGQATETEAVVNAPTLPPLAQAGAQHIVHSHLHGQEPGILPLETALSWADNGPVFRIYCPKKGTPPSNPPTPTSLAIWHPRDSAIPEQFEEQWQKREMESLRQFAQHLEAVNRELPNIAEDQSPGLLKTPKTYRPQTTLELGWAAIVSFFTRLWKGLISLFSGPEDKPNPPRNHLDLRLENMARLRRAVTKLNYKYDARIKWLSTAFLIAFLFAVVSLQLFENLPAEGPIPAWRSALFILAALSVIGCYAVRGWFIRRGYFDRQIDYRALAEGLRVQFYWSAAGLGLSVANHYLQRLRGDTSWIRAALTAVSSPLQKDGLSFRKLDAQKKNDRLQAISNGWLGEQLFYFSRAYHRQSLRQQRVGTVGLILIFTGVTFIGVLAFMQARPASDFIGLVTHCCQGVPCWSPLAWWFGGALLLWLIVQVTTLMTYRVYYGGGKPNCCVKFSALLHYGHHWSYHLIAGVLLGWALLCVHCHYILPDTPAPANGDLDQHLNDFKAWATMAKNILIAGWAAATAYNVFKHADENTKRYAAMRDLFRAAKARMDHLLKQHLEAIAHGNESEQERLLKAMQQHLAALGQEALQENSDWLQMHRIKPVEPQLPVG